MQLIKLVTKNFKRLGNFTADFTTGLNVIAGENARGKSTLLQAIEAALFGVTVVPGKKEHIPTWGQKDFSLELHFVVGDDVLVLTRNKSTAKLLAYSNVDNTERLVANGNTPVTAAVEQLLGLAGKDWNLFVQSRQHEASGILTFGASALNKKVEEFAGIELIDKVQTLAQRGATLYASYAEAKQVDEESQQRADAALAEAQAALEKADAEKAAAKAALVTLPPMSVTKPTRVPAEMRQQAAAHAKATQRVADLVQARGFAEKAVDAAKDNLSAAGEKVDVKQLQDLMTDLVGKGKDLGGKQEALEKQAASRARAEDKLADAIKASEALGDDDPSDEEIEEARAEAEKAEAALEHEQAKAARIKAKIQDLKQLADGATCPTCGHTKEDHNPEKLAAEIAAAQVDLATSEERASGVRQYLQDARKEWNRRDNLHKACAAADAVIAAARATLEATPAADLKELGEILATLTETREQYAGVKAQVAQASEQNARVAAAEKALASASKQLDDANQAEASARRALEQLPTPPTEAEAEDAEEELREYTRVESEWKLERARLKAAFDTAALVAEHCLKDAESAAAKVKELKERQATAAADAVKAKQYDRLVRFLRERRQNYLKDVWDTVLAVSSRLVTQSSRGEITAIANEDGEFLFEEQSILAPASSASGAQKGLIGTALRIGLARALYGSDSLLIFDEPTESCTEANASSMAAALATSAKQVLLITHRENDQVLAENIIHVGE